MVNCCLHPLSVLPWAIFVMDPSSPLSQLSHALPGLVQLFTHKRSGCPAISIWWIFCAIHNAFSPRRPQPVPRLRQGAYGPWQHPLLPLNVTAAANFSHHEVNLGLGVPLWGHHAVHHDHLATHEFQLSSVGTGHNDLTMLPNIWANPAGIQVSALSLIAALI